MRRFFRPAHLLLLLLLLAGACSEDTASGGADQGVRGIVVLGPTCAVETQASPCPDEPLPGVDIRVLRDATELNVSVTSGASGRFELRLPPGTYTLEAVVPEEGPGMFARPVDVTVSPGAFVEITILVDSGIRGPMDTAGG